MDNNYALNKMLDEQELFWDDEESCSTDDDFCLTEEYTCPLIDNRVWKSNIDDIDGGDNFADFCEEFFEMLDEYDYWES